MKQANSYTDNGTRFIKNNLRIFDSQCNSETQQLCHILRKTSTGIFFFDLYYYFLILFKN